MKTKLTMMAAIATACATVQLTAMPTAEETRNAEPVVRKMLAQERAALESGRKTRSEVAVEAMKLAAETDTDAAKLLLMKGAFVLYVRDGNLEKAVETMKALEAAISDMPPQSVTNMIEMALLGVSKKVDGARLYELLDEEKKGSAKRDAPKAVPHKRLEVAEGQKTYGGYTWSYRARNGEATLEAKKDGKFLCAVSPAPAGKVSIPPTLNYIKVTRIGWEAFRNCKELTSVTIPEGVTHIDGRAFDLCDGLKEVKLPSSLKVVGFAAFGKCAGLTSVVIPEGVTSIDNDAFNGCSGLMSVVIPDSVTKIGDRAFGGSGLVSVTMRGECPKASNDIFRKCGKLKAVHVPANAKSWAGMKEWQGIPLVFDAK